MRLGTSIHIEFVDRPSVRRLSGASEPRTRSPAPRRSDGWSANVPRRPGVHGEGGAEGSHRGGRRGAHYRVEQNRRILSTSPNGPTAIVETATDNSMIKVTDSETTVAAVHFETYR